MLCATSRIVVGQLGTSSAHVTQHVMVLPTRQAKRQWLIEMLPTLAGLGVTIVFVASRVDCEELTREMQSHPSVGGKGLRLDSLHGDRHQSDRVAALSALKKGRLHVLIATDVAARGLDADVATVVNFDAAKDMDSHVHRVGRAGRLCAGDGVREHGEMEYRDGAAYTLLAPRDSDFACSLVEAFRAEGRDVTEDLAALAMKSRRHGGGGGKVARRKFGLGFHDEGVSSHGETVGGEGGYYGPTSSRKEQTSHPSAKWSRWG